ncbi:hypothetical protein AB0D47_20355 [Streptomyces sp. NPDC048376]|uniref:hypothetical protein n=1 Tax=Streptomyces sp. NPDC048376 TaxID=3154926 RepID=UPI0034242691
MNLGDPLDQSRPSWVLYNRLLALGVSVDEASSLMSGYAHELAERQRAVNFDWYEDDASGAYLARDHLANLIDPGAPS